jgi:hypothetical protein
MNKFFYFFYLFLLGRNILLLSNGYSNKTTGILLVLNLLLSFMAALVLLFKSKKYNVYLITFILGFSTFYIYYSGYSDMNKNFNKVVYFTYILLSGFEILIFMVIKIKNNKKFKTILQLCFSVLAGTIFLQFLNNYYWEPKNIVYSTQTESVKNIEEILKITEKMPGIKSAYIVKDYEKESLSYEESNQNVYYHYNFKESLEPSDIIMDISLKTLIDDNSLNNLSFKIQNYIKLSGLDDQLIRVYIVTNRDHKKAIKIYDFQNGNVKVRYKRDNPYIAGSSPLANMFALIIKIFKGIVPVN